MKQPSFLLLKFLSVLTFSLPLWGAEYAPQNQFDRCQEILDKLKSHYYYRLNPDSNPADHDPTRYQSLCEGRIPYPHEPNDAFIELAQKILAEYDHGNETKELEAQFLKQCNRSTEQEVELALRLSRVSYFVVDSPLLRRDAQRNIDLSKLPAVQKVLDENHLTLLEVYGDEQYKELGTPKKSGKSDKNGFDAITTRNASGDTIYVTITGTNEIADANSDLALGRSQVESIEAERMLKDLLNIVLDRSTRGLYTKLIFNGHSLGGINAVLAHEFEERIKLQVQAGKLPASALLYSIDSIGFNSIGPHTVINQIQKSYPEQRHPTSLSLYGFTPITISTPKDLVIRSGKQFESDNWEIALPPAYKPTSVAKYYPEVVWQHITETIDNSMFDHSQPVDEQGFHKFKPMHRKASVDISAPKITSKMINSLKKRNSRAKVKCHSIGKILTSHFKDQAYIGADGSAYCLDSFNFTQEDGTQSTPSN